MNPEQCRSHALNNSGSKYAYKFGRSNRFKTPRLHTHSIYQLNRKAQLKKGCSFGIGQRPPLANPSLIPSPQNYILPSTISSKSRTFGSSREQTAFQSFLLSALKSNCQPAPNSYTLPSSHHERKYSLGARLPTQLDIKLKNDNPQPGRYEVAGDSPSGKFASSQFKNVRRIIFFGREIQRKSRGKEIQGDVGPGSYNVGKNYQSLDDRYFRKTCKSFGSAVRPGPQDKSKIFNPGPGMYQTFSQFPTQK